MSLKSTTSLVDTGGDCSSIVRKGYLKKLKTNKKKFFVLRAETPDSSARLEYYDSDKKFNSGQPPKRSILLKTCFNINKRIDTKHKHVIALYTKDDCFCVVLENEEDLDSWLKALLSLQHGEDSADGEMPRPTFEHVWEITILSRGLGTTFVTTKKINDQGGEEILEDDGRYRFCLTDKMLSLVKNIDEQPAATFPLSCIRSCGSLKQYFYLELGRSSTVGAGELWLETEDANIAQNIKRTVFNAMTSTSKKKDGQTSEDELGPKSRLRSSSATETSKSSSFIRPTCPKPIPLTGNANISQTNEQQPVLPTAQPPQQPNVHGSNHHQRGYSRIEAERRHSVSAGSAAWTGTVNHQRTRSLPLAQPTPFTEHSSPQQHQQLLQQQILLQQQQQQHQNQRQNINKRPPITNQSSNKSFGQRERCDSMPTRGWNTNEANHGPLWGKPTHLMPHRPHSLYGKDLSHSPPTGSPISPPSQSDSAGSSLSIDDQETWTEMEGTNICRFNHSITPEEAIAEENGDDCPNSPLMTHGTSPMMTNTYVPMGPSTHSSDDGYVDMSPQGGRHITTSPAGSLISVTSGTPSTDMRFAEYPLEKVISLISEEDNENLADRPARAYSVGSRAETQYRTRLDGTKHMDSRERAFSVGSKTKKVPNRVLPPYSHNHNGPKSSSAPLLANLRAGSHSSIGPMDNLMEIDFSRPLLVNSRLSERGGSRNNIPQGYVDMRPGSIEKNRGPELSPYVDMRGGSSPAKPIYIPLHNDHGFQSGSMDYMDMEPQKNRINVKPSTSPLLPSVSPLSNHPPTTSYMDMNFNKSRDMHLNSYSISPTKSSIPPKYIEGTSPSHTDDYMDMDAGHPNNRTARTPTNEGYVEMSFASKNSTGDHQRQSSLDGSSDYTNMTCGSNKKKAASKKEATRSLPIQIQPNNTNQVPKGSSPSSPMYQSIFYPRKYSTGTPPNKFLPLSSSPFSSLPRQRSRNNSRRDSKDSSSSSVTTPSSSSTIFPISLNSPSSPVKPLADSKSPEPQRGVINLITSVISKRASMTTSNDDTSADYVNYDPAPKNASPKGTPSGDYALMKPGTLQAESVTRKIDPLSDYALMQPGNASIDNDYAMMTPGVITSMSDYAIMRPGAVETHPSINTLISTKMSMMNLNQSSTNCFRPIMETKEDRLSSPKVSKSDSTESESSNYYEMLRPSSSTSDKIQPKIGFEVNRPSSVQSESGVRSSTSRPSSASSELSSSTSTLVGSRPESVNSDRIRPSSTNVEGQLHYASLDLATLSSEDDGAKSPRTSKTSQNTYADIDFAKSEGLKQTSLQH